MDIELIDLKKQYESIQAEANEEVLNVLNSARYIMGKNVLEFENQFANYINAKYAISVGNGTDALVLSLKALGIGEGDEVITTPFTFFATAESIARVGAKPVFIDVKKDTFNIDPSKIVDKINSRTKAIIPVHIFGQPSDMDEILNIAKLYNLYVIEDACQAIGAEYHGEKVGTLGDIGCFSFFPTKNLGCAGDGGMVVTNNEKLASIVRGLRTHGSGENGQKAYNLINNIKNSDIDSDNNINDTIYNPLKYYNYLIGYNSRLDALQAALLKVKLKNIDKWNNSRIQNAKYYDDKLISLKECIIPSTNRDLKHVYHMYILQVDNRSELIKFLKDKGIGTGIYYPIPLHLQKVFKYLEYQEGDMPIAEYLSKRTFAIPMYPELDRKQQDYIISAIKEFFENE